MWLTWAFKSFIRHPNNTYRNINQNILLKKNLINYFRFCSRMARFSTFIIHWICRMNNVTNQSYTSNTYLSLTRHLHHAEPNHIYLFIYVESREINPNTNTNATITTYILHSWSYSKLISLMFSIRIWIFRNLARDDEI